MSSNVMAASVNEAAATDRDWGAVAASTVGLVLSIGTLLLYTFGVFARPLGQEFGWGRTQLAGALALSQYTFAFTAPFWGGAIDRFGPRLVLLVSVVGMSATIASLSLMTGQLWQFYLIFGAGAFVAGAASPVGYAAVLVRKFERHLGLALGLALMGVGLGATVLPPLAQALVAGWGWREAYVLLGGLTLLVTFPAALLATRGVSRPARRTAGAEKTPLLPLIKTRAFMLICVVFLLLGIISIGLLVSVIPIMTGRGFSPAAAAQIAGVTGLVAIAGRGGIGWVLDRVHAPYVVAAAALCAMAGSLLLGYGGGTATAYLAAALLGAVVGAEVDFTAFLVRRYFGNAVFGRLYGLAFGIFLVGCGTGPVLMSASFDRFGSYRPGALLFVGFSLLIVLLTLAMPRYGVANRRETY